MEPLTQKAVYWRVFFLARINALLVVLQKSPASPFMEKFLSIVVLLLCHKDFKITKLNERQRDSYRHKRRFKKSIKKCEWHIDKFIWKHCISALKIHLFPQTSQDTCVSLICLVWKLSHQLHPEKSSPSQHFSAHSKYLIWIDLRYHCTFFASFLISKSLRLSWKQMGRNLNANDNGHPEVSYPVQKILNLFLKVWRFWLFLKSPFFPGVQNR